MLPIAFLLDGPPSYELFEQQLLLCVYVPLFATLFVRVILLQYPQRGRVVALTCALISAAAIILPSYRYVHFGYPYAPSIPVLVAPWIVALVPFGALAIFIRPQPRMAPEKVLTLRTMLSHSAVLLTSVVCFAIAIEHAATLNRIRLMPHLPDYFARGALMWATALFAFCEAVRQLLLRRWSLRRAVYTCTLLTVAIVNALTNLLPATWALCIVLAFLAVYLVNVVYSARHAMSAMTDLGSAR